jgi:hypothetical protein
LTIPERLSESLAPLFKSPGLSGPLPRVSDLTTLSTTRKLSRKSSTLP